MTTEAQPRAELYVPFQGWLRRSPHRPLAVAAGVLIVLQAIVRGWFRLREWFFGDDFGFIERAHEYALLDPHYLFRDWASHFMPLSFVLVWIVTHIAAYNYVIPALIDLAMQAATGIVMYKLLSDLFGRRPMILLPLAWFLFTPLTLPAFLWWAASLNQTPQQLAMIVAWYLQVRYQRTGRRLLGYLGVIAIVVLGLGFSERTLLFVPFLFLFTIFFFESGPPLRRLRTMLRHSGGIWAAYAVVFVGYSVFYVTVIPSPHQLPESPSGVLHVFNVQVLHAVLPSLIGGPFSWVPLRPNGALVYPPTAVVILCALLVATLAAVSVAAKHRAVFAWLIIGYYVGTNMVILAYTRAAYFGGLLAAEMRYATDEAMILAVGLCLAFVSIRGEAVVGEPQRLIPREQSGTLAAGRLLAMVNRPIVIAPLVVASVAASMFSSVGYADIVVPNGGKPLIANARAAIEHLPAGAKVMDLPLGTSQQWSAAIPYSQPSNVLAPYGLKVPVMAPGASTELLGVFDKHGHLRRARIDGLGVAKGPDGACGYYLSPGSSVTMKLQPPTLIGWDWVLRFGYIASKAGSATIQAGQTTTVIPINTGPNDIYVMVRGKVDAVRILNFTGNACSASSTVGFAKPIPGTSLST